MTKCQNKRESYFLERKSMKNTLISEASTVNIHRGLYIISYNKTTAITMCDIHKIKAIKTKRKRYKDG